MQHQSPDKSAKIVALNDKIKPNIYLLNSDICIIGRADNCHVIVVDEETVSRFHAVIERIGSQYVIHDSNSANGTYLNGQQIHEPQTLKDQDEISLSKATAMLRFEIPA